MTREEFTEIVLAEYERNALWTIQDMQTPLTMKITLEMLIIIIEALEQESIPELYKVEGED